MASTLSPGGYVRHGQRGVSPPRSVNVQVAVRCRPLNSRERSSGERTVLTCAEERREVICSAPNAVRKGGSAAANPKKMYTYDHVFGPDASQADVYEGIVEPIVDEVLQGYNCTVFAYGQTGTGKTHTMEGRRGADMVGFEERRLAENAGIIPRAVKQVFDHLRSITDEHSVRVSHLELYNEQLSDLLGPADVVNDTLRMYEDPQKGTFVQGLEDIVVRSEEEIFAVLDKSAVKRRTAETLMNKYSSRSHSVFSITIHIKESTPEGADLLKVGKLNLVDLAGSENVGRSGAVKGRAREAGNINQSLLTLGRVITALVDRHPHVPYRDSKLTRLLQESLGGRNKTCVIATVTPGSSSAEETASTLDYAYRAKSIKNRPTVNQMIAKHVLLKEYTEEIQKLKRELDANRMKNGVYLPADEFQRLQAIANQQKDTISHLEARNEDFEKKAANLKDKLDRTQDALARDQKKLSLTKQELETVKGELSSTQNTLEVVCQQKAENAHLVRKHVGTEVELHQKGIELQGTLDLCVGDIRALHTRVNAKQELEKENFENLVNLQNTVAKGVAEISDSLQAHEETHVSLLQDSETDSKVLLEKLSNSLGSMHLQLEEFSTRFSKIEKVHEDADRELSTEFHGKDEEVFDSLRAALSHHKARVAETSQNVSNSSATIRSMLDSTREIMGEVQSAIGSHSAMEESHRELLSTDILETIADLKSNVSRQVRRQAELFGALKIAAEEQAEKQAEFVKRTRSNLIAQVTAVMNEFEQESSESRGMASAMVASKTEDAEQVSYELKEAIVRASETTKTKCDVFFSTCSEGADELKATVRDKSASLATTCAAASKSTSNVQSSLHTLTKETDAVHINAFESIDGMAQRRANFVKEAAQKRGRDTQERSNILSEQNRYINHIGTTLSDFTSEAHSETCRKVKVAREQLAVFVTEGKDGLTKTVVDPIKSHAISCDTKHDETPIVRQWPVKETLVRTRNHEELISELRRSKDSPAVPIEDFGHLVQQNETTDVGELSSSDSPTSADSVDFSKQVFPEEIVEDRDEQETATPSSAEVDESHEEKNQTKMTRSRSTASLARSTSGTSINRSASAEPIGTADRVALKTIVEKEEVESAPVLNDTTNRRTRLRVRRGESMIPKKPSGIPSARMRGSTRTRAKDVK